MKAESENFLLADFNQYHEWMRHYDKSFSSMISFLYTGYAAVITASFALYSKYPDKFEANLGVGLLLAFASCLSPVFIYWLMKKRKYFSDTARWVNKIRNTYLINKPLGIDAPAVSLQNENYPPYFHFASTHVILLLFTALSSSVIFCLTVYAAIRAIKIAYCTPIGLALYYAPLIILVVFWHICLLDCKTFKGIGSKLNEQFENNMLEC